MIRVLVVDDSAFMRRAIAKMLTADPEIEVVGSVGNGIQAIEAVKALGPDVVTLDVDMPVMDGLAALRRIMAAHPLPVVMLSTLTQLDAEITLTALALGAFDFVAKPSAMIGIINVEQELCDKVKAAAASAHRSRTRTVLPTRPVRPATGALSLERTSLPAHMPEVIGIGASTGGPGALETVLAALPADFPVGMVVVQHMPPGFTRALATRLDQHSSLSVREAGVGDRVLPGQVLVAPAGKHLVLRRSEGVLLCGFIEDRTDRTWHKPSVDVLFASMAQQAGDRAMAVVMTGMGNDGTSGAVTVKERGGAIWAQDEASSVVYGMPKTVFEAGIVDRVLSLGDLSAALCELMASPRV